MHKNSYGFELGWVDFLNPSISFITTTAYLTAQVSVDVIKQGSVFV